MPKSTISGLPPTATVNAADVLPLDQAGTTKSATVAVLLGGLSSPGTAGDIEITLATKGLILKSPDASRWRVTIENDGSLTVTKLP